MGKWRVVVGDDQVTIETAPPGQTPRIRLTIASGQPTVEGSPSDIATFRQMLAAAVNVSDGSRTDGPTS